jgi:hypothetical protein
LYRSLKSLSELFDDDDPNGILLADYCSFKPGQDKDCAGGLFEEDDGLRRLQFAKEMDETFPTYDAGGNKMTPVHRLLGACPSSFSGPDCEGTCSCAGAALAKCKAKKLKCKAQNTEGLRVPFSKCFARSATPCFGHFIHATHSFNPFSIVQWKT